ncbi:tetratricopeptide repeat protein [Usitatibacter palustris]|uniref:tetratricopeptide repeat protein n=1 Tax=Usitatibacter palustris TaxID=2732487 RepID=UPI00148828F6|nr:SEL1-like repeat protein [Usitatibacter palustris]
MKLAFRLFRARAESGDKNAFLNLGYFYDVGLGVRKDQAEALRWYRRAARAGDSAAASNIGTVYREAGRHRLALEWFKRAASMNDGDAEVEIAKHYLEGMGVAPHRGRAMAALRRAVASGSITDDGREEAQSLLDCMKGPR